MIMANYSTATLFIAVAIFWSSTSARPQSNLLQIDDFVYETTKWTLKKIQNEPEPYRTRLTKLFEEAQRAHWNSINEYGNWITNAADDIYAEFGHEGDTSDDFMYSKEGRGFIVGAIIAIAPPAHKLVLEQKLGELLDMEYKSFNDFGHDIDNIFGEVTGIDLDDYFHGLRSQMQAGENRNKE